MIGRDVAMRREAQIHHAVGQRQRRPVMLQKRIEGNHTVDAVFGGPRHARRNRHRTVRLLEAGRDVERVKLLLITARTQLDLRHDVQRPAIEIDHRRGGDSDNRHQVAAAEVGRRHRGNARAGLIKLVCHSAGPGLSASNA